MEDREVKKKKLPSHDVEAEVFKLIDSVCKHYHKKLLTNKKALEYLETGGIAGEKIRYEFGLGFSDNSLISLLSEEQKKLLKEKGLIKPKGSELFSNCITVPVTDDYSKIVNIIGLRISDDKIINLDESGIFNRKACKLGSREIILTENIKDALCLIAKGFYNTQVCEADLTDEHLKYLKQNRTNTAILNFTVKKKTHHTKEALIKCHINVKAVHLENLPELTKEQIEEHINSSKTYEADKKDCSFNVRREDNNYWFNRCDITYRLSGVKNVFVSTLRVNVKTTCKDLSYYDTIDLYSSRAREGYANKLSRTLDIEPKLLENDLIKILEYLEETRDRELEKNKTSVKETTVSDDDKKIGMKFLTSSDIFTQIEKDMTALGYVSESENKLIVYLAGVSRFLPNPLNVYIQADSAGGKSALLNTLEKMLPPGRCLESFYNFYSSPSLC